MIRVRTIVLVAVVLALSLTTAHTSDQTTDVGAAAPPRDLAGASPRLVQVDDAYLISLILTRARVCGIQFDDGIVTHYTVATPILLQYGLAGSFGIVTGNTNVNPNAMTDAQIWEMYSVYGFDFQDHTWDADAALWGNPAKVATWQQHISWSQEVFQRIGFPDTMRAWNQPGGAGEGWSDLLRSTLKSRGYRYAAGRVGLINHQFRNMHFGAIDDPFSWGRWCYSWKYNAPAATLEFQGVDPNFAGGRQLLEAIVATTDGNVPQCHALLLNSSPSEVEMVHSIAAAWTWQAEVAAIETRYADAWAQGGFPIMLFHSMDADATAGLDALCAWLVAHDAVVLGMDDLNTLAQMNRSYQNGLNIAPPIHTDIDGNGEQDGDDLYVFMDVNGNAHNGAGTTFMGAPPGKLVVSVTIRTPLQTGTADDFSTVYERYSIDPDTWQYTVEPPELRPHTIHQGETLTAIDTLTIDERVDRVKFWIQSINQQPFVIDDWSAVPLANPTRVTGRTPTMVLAVSVWPSPTSERATLAFHLESQTVTSLAIYDVHGRLVERLIDRQPLVGDVRVTWPLNHVASGIYFAKVIAGKATTAQKITLVR
jgi:hypothetical protein